MSWRTVIISNQSKLDYKMGYLVVRGIETTRIAIDEIAILVVENPAVSITGILLEALSDKKIKVIFCDSKRNPTAELVPHHGSHDCSSKIRTQIKWGSDVKAIIWREIISEKIRKQEEFLRQLGKYREAELLLSYVGQVELLDTTNREGHAAKVYFNALFGMDFTRSADVPVNAALNYGYSILLSAFNREVSINGYLTQLGIFHDKMFNHFNLSCDLMEPYRVMIDRHVHSMHLEKFEKEEKHELWRILDATFEIDGYRRDFSNTIKIYTRSVFDSLNDSDPGLIKHFSFIE